MIYSIKVNEDVDEFIQRNHLEDAVTHRFKYWKYLLHVDVEDPYSLEGDYTVSQDTGIELSIDDPQLHETSKIFNNSDDTLGSGIGVNNAECPWSLVVSSYSNNANVFWNTVGYPHVPWDTDFVWHLDAVHNRGVKHKSNTFTSSKTGSGVNIYILDTPLRMDHPEIVGRVTTVNEGLPDSSHEDWYTPPDGSFDPPYDTATICDEVSRFHGLYTAMCAAGTSMGVAPDADIITVPCGFNDGSISSIYIELGLEAIVSHHLRQSPQRNAIINFSIGASFDPILNVVPHKGDSTGIDYAYKHLFMDIQESYNICVIKSAGNRTPGWFYKAIGHHVPYGTCNSGYKQAHWTFSEHSSPSFSIGVSTREDTFAEWAVYGQAVFLAAPGSYLVVPSANATIDDETKWSNDEHWWRVIHGSSFSAPIVAGLVALYLQDKPIPVGADVDDSCTTNAIGEWLITNATQGVIDNIGSYEHTMDPFLTYQNTNGNSCVVVDTTDEYYGYLDYDVDGLVTSYGVFLSGYLLALDFTIHRKMPENYPFFILSGRVYIKKATADDMTIPASEETRLYYEFDFDGSGVTRWFLICIDRSALSTESTSPILTKDLTYSETSKTSNLLAYNPYTVTTNTLFTLK